MTTAILWFRRDLRLADNPALEKALQTADDVVAVFIHSPEEEGAWADGSASRWWLHHSLSALDESLRRLGSRLLMRRGPSLQTLRRLIEETGAEYVYWNRLYEPSGIARDKTIKATLHEQGLIVESFNAGLLYEPWEITRGKGEPYKVFTPYWKALLAQGINGSLLPIQTKLPAVSSGLGGLSVHDLALLPKIRWDAGLEENWTPGEAGAWARIDDFLSDAVCRYSEARDRPDHEGVSKLAPYLHFGEIGPRQVVHALQARLAEGQGGAECFSRQLVWREFAHHLLFHNPNTPESPLDRRFLAFSWNEPQPEILSSWQQGKTGVPLVDAGMRQLWQTGWMHNRVRMVVASFLVKNLRIHWQEGARWFWDTLVDADLANNTLGWQWVAGCGADAAPYFRIFNPVLQGERFDPEGDYVRRWVPELSRLPKAFIHQPWQAPESVLRSGGVRLGENYPFPMVDLKTSREAALAAFKQMGAQSKS